MSTTTGNLQAIKEILIKLVTADPWYSYYTYTTPAFGYTVVLDGCHIGIQNTSNVELATIEWDMVGGQVADITVTGSIFAVHLASDGIMGHNLQTATARILQILTDAIVVNYLNKLTEGC